MVGIMIAGQGSGPTTMQFDGGDAANTKSKRDGSFEFQDLPAGNYEVKVSHPDYAEWTSEPVAVGTNSAASMAEVQLGPSADLDGTVVRREGQVPAVVMVQLRSLAGGEPRTSMARDGTFQFRGLPPGRYKVWARDPMTDQRPPDDDADAVEVLLESGKPNRVSVPLR
jgi:hypothetical protein